MSYEDVEQEFINSILRQINKWSLDKNLSKQDHESLLKHIEEDLRDERCGI